MGRRSSPPPWRVFRRRTPRQPARAAASWRRVQGMRCRRWVGTASAGDGGAVGSALSSGSAGQWHTTSQCGRSGQRGAARTNDRLVPGRVDSSPSGEHRLTLYCRRSGRRGEGRQRVGRRQRAGAAQCRLSNPLRTSLTEPQSRHRATRRPGGSVLGSDDRGRADRPCPAPGGARRCAACGQRRRLGCSRGARRDATTPARTTSTQQQHIRWHSKRRSAARATGTDAEVRPEAVFRSGHGQSGR